jgi:hypothetical protein
MGAVSTLLYSSTYYKERVVALCLDSPFKDLTFLCEELMIGYNVRKNINLDMILINPKVLISADTNELP